jgi:hypothetical protein
MVRFNMYRADRASFDLAAGRYQAPLSAMGLVWQPSIAGSVDSLSNFVAANCPFSVLRRHRVVSYQYIKR